MTGKSTGLASKLTAYSASALLSLVAGAAFAQQSGAGDQPSVGVQQSDPNVNVETAEPNVRVVPPREQPNVQGDEDVNVRMIPPEQSEQDTARASSDVDARSRGATASESDQSRSGSSR